jgi:site-specific recombinase XerD
VAGLRLDDIDWRHGELVVRGKANRHERLPLPRDVGAAIASYLERGRPKPTDGCRAVFLRTRAPFHALGLQGVQTVVRDVSIRAGIGRIGPRRLRQHAATTMQQTGLGLGAIAQVLRQRNLRVTTRYVSLDQAGLVELARPWPGATR